MSTESFFEEPIFFFFCMTLLWKPLLVLRVASNPHFSNIIFVMNLSYRKRHFYIQDKNKITHFKLDPHIHCVSSATEQWWLILAHLYLSANIASIFPMSQPCLLLSFPSSEMDDGMVPSLFLCQLPFTECHADTLNGHWPQNKHT